MRTGIKRRKPHFFKINFNFISLSTGWTREAIDVFIPAPYAFWWLPISSIFSCPFPFFDVRLWMWPWQGHFLLRRTFHRARQLILLSRISLKLQNGHGKVFISFVSYLLAPVIYLTLQWFLEVAQKVSNFCSTATICRPRVLRQNNHFVHQQP